MPISVAGKGKGKGGRSGVPSGQLRSPGSGETASMRSAPSDIDETRRPNSRASARVRNAESEGGRRRAKGLLRGAEERKRERRGVGESEGVTGAQ